MILGIDVGGTYTDGVLTDQQAVIQSAKRPTDSQDLPKTLIRVMDDLLEGISGQEIKRVVLSTTLVTNLIATGETKQIAVLLLPGAGLPCSAFALFPNCYFLKGGVDFRGQVVEKLDRAEVENTIRQLASSGCKKFVIAGKFSNRNDQLVREIEKKILAAIPEASVLLDNETAGQLNFMRRIATAFYSMYALEPWQEFARAMDTALTAKGIHADIDILKADGGTTPLPNSLKNPCETIFSGPAASVMGGMALNQSEKNAIVLDIGGTTSDIALLIDGRPLYASRGASINQKLTHIRSFSVSSLALGGDSPISIINGQPAIQSIRQGPALCFGGKQATITDVLNVSEKLDLGKADASRSGIQTLAQVCGRTEDEIVSSIVTQVLDRLEQAIHNMFEQWRDEPAYKVWEITHGKTFAPTTIIGIGAASSAIITKLAARMRVKASFHKYSPIANALGAALARPTADMRLHADTARQFYTVDPGHGKQQHKFKWDTQLDDIKQLAEQEFLNLTQQIGVEKYFAYREFYKTEQFNIIRGWDTEGKIFDVGLQITPGIIDEFKGVTLL